MHFLKIGFYPLCCLVLLAVSLCPPTVQAGPVSCGDKPIRLAFYSYGYLYFNENMGGQGIDKDIVDELAKRTACKFDMRVMPRARIWFDLENGGLDMSVSGIQNPVRDLFAWFAPYLSMKNYVVVRASLAASVPSAERFINQPTLRFGVVRSFKHGVQQDQWLEQLRASQRVEDSNSIETLFKKLQGKHIDALFSPPLVYAKSLEDLGFKKEAAILDWTPQEKGVHLGLILAKSRFNEVEAKKWQALVNGMRADGSLQRIYSRYLSAAEVTNMLDF